MAKKKDESWFVAGWNWVDKVARLYGPNGVEAEIDFDDVNHQAVEATGNRMVAILNKHWGDPDIPPATWDEEVEE